MKIQRLSLGCWIGSQGEHRPFDARSGIEHKGRLEDLIFEFFHLVGREYRLQRTHDLLH